MPSINRHTLANHVRESDLPPGVEAVYLFGSARYEDPYAADVDLLVIYAAGLEREASRRIGEPVRKVLGSKLDAPVHLLLLSPAEVTETGFIDTEDAVQVWP